MKNKYKPGATTGKLFEDKMDEWLERSKLTFKRDETLSNAKVRRKDIGCDRRVILDDKEVYLEYKHIKGALDYQISLLSSKQCKLKPHQIRRMDYLIIQYENNPVLCINKWDFVMWGATLPKMSMNYKDAKSIGIEITDMEWIKEL